MPVILVGYLVNDGVITLTEEYQVVTGIGQDGYFEFMQDRWIFDRLVGHNPFQ